MRRDDGSTTHALVPSLWQQATEATRASSEQGARGGSASERNIVDLTLLEARSLICERTAAWLRARSLTPSSKGTAAQIRQLAAHVVTHDVDELWWWEYRFGSWARLLQTLLATSARKPQSVRLRNSACPQCSARQVTIESDDGPLVAPALRVDFRDGYVRAAQCSSCEAMWWRGDDLARLADLLR